MNTNGKMTGRQYVELLEDNLLETAHHLGLVESDEEVGWSILHDRDPSHRSRVCQQWFESKGYNQILIPGNSPDIK